MLAVFKRSLLGALAGYAVYVVVVCIDIVIQYLRYGHSTFESFYVWIYPFTAQYLLTRWLWKEGPLEDNLLTLCGGLLLIVGIVWANCKRHY
jgi:hypothetical protein